MTNLLDIETAYNYGFISSYGIGFGFPALLDLDDSNLDCGISDFHNIIDEFQFNTGINECLIKINGAEGSDGSGYTFWIKCDEIGSKMCMETH